MRMMPYRTVDKIIAGVVITFTDVTEISAAEARIQALTRDLRDRIESLQRLLDLVPVAIFMQTAGSGGAPQIEVNRYAARLLGDTGDYKGPREIAAKGRFFERGRELAQEDQPLQRAARTGERVPDFEGRIRRADGSSVDVMISETPLFDEQGMPRGAIAAVVDISPMKQAAATQRLLLRELQHRVKNMLATTISLATRMLKEKPSPNDFAEGFLVRLRAMGAMHELLARSRWGSAELRDIVTAALAEYADVRAIAINGPPVTMKPRTAAGFGLVLHELATNAAKHGALADGKGRVEVSWSLEGDNPGEVLSLRWRERDGPRIDEAPKEGFGITFVKRSVEYELDGETSIVFAPEGIDVALKIPLGKDEAPDPTEA
jgi:two-component system CheB/CheR fusion protein